MAMHSQCYSKQDLLGLSLGWENLVLKKNELAVDINAIKNKWLVSLCWDLKPEDTSAPNKSMKINDMLKIYHILQQKIKQWKSYILIYMKDPYLV